MTSPERDYEDILRRALRAAAESVEPAADGLDRIRGRLSAPRVSPFVLLTEFLRWLRPILLRVDSGLAAGRSSLSALATRLRLPARAGQVLGRLQPALGAVAALTRPVLTAVGGKTAPRPRAAHRSQPPPNGLRARLGSTFTRLGPAASWLRPVLAVAGAVAIVVAGVFALGQAQQFITPTNQITRPSATHHKATSAATSPGGWTLPIGVNQATPTPTTASSPGAQPVTSCPPSPKVKPSSLAPATSKPPTPSQSATPTLTPTDTATPSASPTDTSAGGTSASGAAAGQVASVGAARLPVPCTSAANSS
jgi:hypothetical protein